MLGIKSNGYASLTVMKSLAWIVQRRLEFIEFRLYWQGRINRRDLIDFFGISVPQAAKDFRSYQCLAPGNIDYDLKIKSYFATQNFKAIFFHPDSDEFFEHLELTRKGEGMLGRSWLGVIPEFEVSPTAKRHINPNILRAIVHAIHEKRSIKVRYQSMHRDKPGWREISPHALASDGFRWHVRAFCHERETYRDFVLARILKIKKSKISYVDQDDDQSWLEIIDISIIPNPKLKRSQKKAIELDYGMKVGRLIVAVRQALLFYFLTEMRLDFDKFDGETAKPPRVHPLIVENRDEVAHALEKVSPIRTGWRA